MSRRYDSEEYLQDWKTGGVFPDIHKPIVDLMAAHVGGREVVLDLCCSTGILGAQIRTRVTRNVVGIEGNLKPIALGRRYGVVQPIYEVTITPQTWPEVDKIISHQCVTVVVARRCLSEIFGERPEWGPVVAQNLKRLGVRRIFLQGRAFSKRSTHPIPNTEAEIRLLAGAYDLQRMTPPVGSECAYLTCK
jgi:hypothetical protein